ncbi:nucleotide-binding universal stress UspA family protein [Mesonia hippocampi]|uniref:Nucleotide-binding universal stress UspA family protein n=1 Tax=Mesonia hippocampi TaxID=1628250 RepID=A0A840EVA9_9FLAO|nr:universal stress protein [Mesonia hippocampi]MBB4119426.1 nucleotide-binding universal stress UspA family protein [Mesonia hippocampi]
MKKILVPTDFSEQAEDALKVAAQIAKKHDSEIFLLHMLELPTQLMDPSVRDAGSSIPESIYFMKLAHQRFEDVMSRDYLNGITVHETVQFNSAFEGIMAGSKEHGCDLVVMGSQGASGLKEAFIGSNTEKVVRHSNIPVLVIKDYIEIDNIKSFVYATDFTEESKKSFNEAVNFAKTIDATLHLIYVNTPNKFKTTDYTDHVTNNYLKGLDLKNYSLTVYNDESVEKGILNYAGKVNADLLGISTHGRKGLAHFLNGSISEDLINHAQRPVITFKV